MRTLYFLTLVCFLLYSYCLVDPNITLFNHPAWTAFRNAMVQVGYHQRGLSSMIFLVLITALVFEHIKMQSSIKIDPIRVAIATAGILLLSYPFLSRDMFNYMFDARILTVHGANPYLHAALDFPQDQWLRFMHWTHRPYPYGPTFLPITLVPSYLSTGKFLLNFVFFKMMYAGFYIAGVIMLGRIKKSYALFFATHPLVIIEGLINTHNDFIAVILAILGIYYFRRNLTSLPSKLVGWLALVASTGIKFLTLPTLLLGIGAKPSKKMVAVSATCMAILIAYLSFTGEVQEWYFLNFLVFIPFLYPLLRKGHIFSYGLLLSYYPFIRYGEWDSTEKLFMKHIIILSALIINILFIIYRKPAYESH